MSNQDYNIIVGKRIRALRLALNLSQSEFGEQLGYSGDHVRNTVDKLETGAKDPSGPVVKLLERMQLEITRGGKG